MVRLSESKSKAILSEHGVTVPKGEVAETASDARAITTELDSPVVAKAQVGVTKRADRGLIRFADSADEVESYAEEILGRTVEGATISEIRIEEQRAIAEEWYAGVIIDSEAKMPRVLFSTVGGTGVESLTKDHPDDVVTQTIHASRNLRSYEAYDIVRRLDIHDGRLRDVGDLLASLISVFRTYDARSVEVNPIAVTEDGDVLALDARISIDDAAVSRHPEIEVNVAREFGRDPTELEKIAYEVEEGDYRGTFYFIQTELDVDKVASGDSYIGFHGAGGGGSMMSLDAVTQAALNAANYTDTSGNPPASKIYKAARIILSQPGLVGYLYSGSGAASQEMYTTARGLMKAFIDEGVTIPIVLRLGGNAEDEAIDIVDAYADQVPAPIEAYGGEESARFCANRLQEFIETNRENHQAALNMSENASLSPSDIDFDLEIEDDLEIEGLAAYRERIMQRPAVQQAKEVPSKWAF